MSLSNRPAARYPSGGGDEETFTYATANAGCRFVTVRPECFNARTTATTCSRRA